MCFKRIIMLSKTYITLSVILLFYSISLLLCETKIGKSCTSSRIDCAFNLTKEPRIYFTELFGAKPYNKICRFSGRLYQLGWKIPTHDPCIICKCNELWDDRNPLESLACNQINCQNQLQPKLEEGCLPVYKDGICCPIDYNCREQCVFNGTRYAIGSIMYLNFENNLCNECKCSAPPTFTCIDHYCPQIPDNCTPNPIDKDKGCCPTYECIGKKE